MGDVLPTVKFSVGREATAIVAAYYHSCVLLEDASVKCWGYNLYGQLGLGDSSDRGKENDEMGDALPAVNLGTDRTAVAVTAGFYHTCALLDDASVKCWGDNYYGQLGVGDVDRRGDQSNEMGDALPAVNLGTGRTAVAVTAGHQHTCALLDDASVKCWGYNLYGQLGLGDSHSRGGRSEEMGDTLQAVNLGSGRTAVSIAAGAYHTCAVLDDASVKCWGYNETGQLGLGDTSHRGDESSEMGDNLPRICLW
jgi:hypothetical protein